MTTFQDLHNGLTSLEQDYNTLQTQVTNYKAVVADMNSQIANEKAKSSSLQTQLDQAQANLAKAQAAFDAYKQSHPDPTPAARFPGDPGLGEMYVGLSTLGGDPAKRNAAWGTTAGAFRSYWQWGQNDQMVAVAKRDLANHTLPVISYKDSGQWANVAAGKDDAILVDLSTKLAALKQPVVLAQHHEPTDDTATEGSPEDFVASYLRIQTIMAPNVTVTPILQSAPFDPTVGGNPAGLLRWLADSRMYDNLVCFDTYNHKSYNPANKAKYRDPATVLSFLDVVRKTLGTPDLPIGIAEFGTRTNPTVPGQAAQWLRDFAAQAKTKNVPFICVFDSGLNVNDGGSPWKLDDRTDGTDGTERFNAYGPLVKAGAHLS